MAVFRIRKEFASNNFEYGLEVDFQLESFSEYINITEELIEKEIKREIIKYDKFLKESSEYEIHAYYDAIDHIIKTNIHQLYYNSLFISLYSFLEKKMYQFCKLAEQNYPIKVKDLSDDGIFKYHKYLKKVVGIDFEKLNTEWTHITKYNKLRNLLVHSPTTEIENTENFQNQIKTLKSIEGLTFRDKADTIEFQINDKKLLRDFYKTISVFLHEIYCERD